MSCATALLPRTAVFHKPYTSIDIKGTPNSSVGPAVPQNSDLPVDLSQLKRSSVQGGLITIVSQGLGVVIQLVSTLVLSRLLSPRDYGLMVMIMAVNSFAGVFRDLGLSSAAVQASDLDHAKQSNLFWLNVGMGALLTVFVAAASPLVSWFYGESQLIELSAVLSAIFLIGSIGTQHGASLSRRMAFGINATANIGGSITSLVVSILLAFQGYSCWALVWGSVSGAFFTTTILIVFSGFRPSLPSRGSGLRSILKFGANVTAANLADYFHRNLDNILIGKFLGPEPVGLYSRAYSLLMLPINTLRGPIHTVGFPALSRLQHQTDAYRDYYRKITRILALISMPITGYLFVVSEPIIGLLLGQKWLGISPIFKILALVGFIQPVVTLWGMVLLSRGMHLRYLRMTCANAVFCGIGFVAGMNWGPEGVAAGYAVATYLAVFPTLQWAFRGTPLRMMDFIGSVARPVLAGTISAALSTLIMLHLLGFHVLTRLFILGLAFSLLYIAILAILPGRISDFSLLLKIAHHVSARRSRRRVTL